MKKKTVCDGVYQLIGGNLVPVTHAIEETEDSATFMMYDEMKTHRVMPIGEACAQCTSWKKHGFKSIQECQAFQGGDAIRRGFRKLVCPKQFVEEES